MGKERSEAATTVAAMRPESPRTESGDWPPNLHVSVMNSASVAPRLSERVEQKFFITPQRESAVFALLRRTCRADTEYSVGRVNSLYFDTPDLDQHQRSDSGELLKDKIRIRWYGDEHDPHRAKGGVNGRACTDVASLSADPGEDLVRVWLELKSRRGFASTKQRLALEIPASALVFGALSKGIVPPITLARTVAGFGFFTHGPLRPVVAISYWRYRFVEPETGFRISIDSRIRSSMVMPGIGRGERALELPGAVVEVKGSKFEVPHSLRPIAEIGSSWTRYSKYSSSLDAHDTVRGSVSRLWPNGMMDAEPGILSRVDRTMATERAGSSQVAIRLVEDYETE
jgi:hypothetical protein